MSEASPAIQVRDLQKRFMVPEREAGLFASVRSLFRRRTREVSAVADVSFTIAPGAIVGFLGPNGAGKTTTLKMLSGLLHPSSGAAQVLGYTPARREGAFLRQITLVMGNRNQLQWDLPALDSFELQRAIYRIPGEAFRATRDELIEMMQVADLVRKPVRNLSLGERMKMEIIGALLHRPQILFLDEPTIGLDVTMQRRIRTFLAEYNQRYGATIMLTSHYMADIEALCKRVIVIHQGRVLFDGLLSGLVAQFAAYKQMNIVLPDAVDLSGYGTVIEAEGGRVLLRVPKAEASQVTARLLAAYPAADLTIEEPPIDDIIDKVFSRDPRAAEA